MGAPVFIIRITIVSALGIQVSIAVSKPLNTIVVVGIRIGKIVFIVTIKAAATYNHIRQICTVLSATIGISNVYHIYVAILHGNGKLLLGIEGFQGGQQPILGELLNGNQRFIGEGNILYIHHLQGHMQIEEQLGQVNIQQTSEGIVSGTILEVNGKAAKGGEAAGFEDDVAIGIHFTLDGTDITLIVHVENLNQRILGQVHLGEGQLHLDIGAVGLPVAAFVVLHGDVVQEDLLRVLGQNIHRILNCFYSFLGRLLNRQRASLGQAVGIDGGAIDGSRSEAGETFFNLLVGQVVNGIDLVRRNHLIGIVGLKIAGNKVPDILIQTVPRIINLPHRAAVTEIHEVLLQHTLIEMVTQRSILRATVANNLLYIIGHLLRGCGLGIATIRQNYIGGALKLRLLTVHHTAVDQLGHGRGIINIDVIVRCICRDCRGYQRQNHQQAQK